MVARTSAGRTEPSECAPAIDERLDHPAARALNAGAEYGLEVADVILSLNGTTVKSLAELRSMIGRLPDNAPVALQIQRSGQLLFLSFEIE